MEIRTLQEFDAWCSDILSTFGSTPYIVPVFRGHESDTYELISTMGRNKDLTLDEFAKFDQLLLSEFKSEIIDDKFGDIKIDYFRGEEGYLGDWKLLMQMRHLGIPSRLIDWTLKARIALYFAVCDTEHWDKDGEVWYYLSIKDGIAGFSLPLIDINHLFSKYTHITSGDQSQELLSKIDPFSLDKSYLVQSPYYLEDFEMKSAEMRRAAQHGKFIITPYGYMKSPLNKMYFGQLMNKVNIPASSKEEICKELTNLDFTDQRVLEPISVCTMELIKEIESRALKQLNVNNANQ